ncbi:MAG TPA: alpha/beta hydrolase-fold protein [Alphaproteobacteria bacterium]|nr:alpha/beta hydrolase-fold protein [Alphaproteobacteria bacterium]
MLKHRTAPRGTLHRLTLDSTLLKAGLLGDPTARDVHVYVPAGQDGQGLPLLVDLVGFTGGGPSHTNWKNFGENVPERLDRLIAEGMPPVVVAFPDCFTRLGGNQYINSSAMGPWENFLIDEMLPFIEGRFGCGGAGRRGVFGKSSGGYGAIIHAMRRADVWAAAACHSGDMAFELCYLPDMPATLRALAKHGGSVEKFLAAFEANPKPSGDDIHALMGLAMAATYDPDPTQHLGIRLPVDPDTCELIEERWANWLAWDPVRIVDAHAGDLKRLKALYIDCGDVDQYNLVYGARRLHRALDRLRVKHRYEEFQDNHSGIDYRMDTSLPYLVTALG